MQPIESAAVKAGISIAATVLVLFRMKNSGKPLEWFGLRAPPLLPTLILTTIYLTWMFGTDWLTHWRGPWNFEAWRQAPLLASVLRLVAVCIFGPLVEELIFRGVAFSWLAERINIGLTIVVTAAAWSVLHYDYDWWEIGIIFVDGLILGVTRWRTRSVLAPAGMHMLYNLYAIW